jgi:hypothetical protein
LDCFGDLDGAQHSGVEFIEEGERHPVARGQGKELTPFKAPLELFTLANQFLETAYNPLLFIGGKP